MSRDAGPVVDCCLQLAGETVPQEEFNRRLDLVLEHGAPAARAFFRTDHHFTGALFDTLGRDELPSKVCPRSISVVDLLAVTLLDVRLPAHAVTQLLDQESCVRLAEFLGGVGNVDLWTLDESIAERASGWSAFAAWDELVDLDRVGPTIASKILSRMRPRLIPIQDRVTRRVLSYGRDENDWRLFMCALRDSERLEKARGLRADVSALLPEPQYPILRIIDAASWMLGGESKPVRRALGLLPRGKNQAEPEPGFLEARNTFLKRAGIR